MIILPFTVVATDKDVDGEQYNEQGIHGRPVRYTNSFKICRLPIELGDGKGQFS